jgi:hypothetical protein
VNLFIVTDQTSGGVWAFTEHAPALAWKRSRPKKNRVLLTGVALNAVLTEIPREP